MSRLPSGEKRVGGDDDDDVKQADATLSKRYSLVPESTTDKTRSYSVSGQRSPVETPPGTASGNDGPSSFARPPTRQPSTGHGPSSLLRHGSLTGSVASLGHSGSFRKQFRQNSSPPSAILPPRGSLRAQSSSASTPSAIFGRALDSYNASTVAAALETDVKGISDAWQAICVRVLPLFNGEGLRGYVEDLNDLVTLHVERTFARHSSRSRHARSAEKASLVAGIIAADMTELVSIGCLTLTLKLVPNADVQSLPDDKLLLRLNELWSFFWSDVLPHLEACFWPLRNDSRLEASAQETKAESDEPGSQDDDTHTLDIRKLALIGFRDSLVLPHVDRIASLLEDLHASRPSSAQPLRNDLSGSKGSGRTSPIVHRVVNSTSTTATVTPSPHHSRPSSPLLRTANPVETATRRQMLAILAALRTNDARQEEIEHLLYIMRYKSGEQGNLASVRAEVWPATPLDPRGEPVAASLDHRSQSIIRRELPRRSTTTSFRTTSDSIMTSAEDGQRPNSATVSPSRVRDASQRGQQRDRSDTIDSTALTFESEETDEVGSSSPSRAGADARAETPRAPSLRLPRHSIDTGSISSSFAPSTMTGGGGTKGKTLRTKFLSKLPGFHHHDKHVPLDGTGEDGIRTASTGRAVGRLGARSQGILNQD